MKATQSEGQWIYLSFATSELYFAASLVKELKQNDLPIWFGPEHIIPGPNWREQLTRAISQSNGLVILVSRNALVSEVVRFEYETAIRLNKSIYLAYFEAVDLPLALADYPAIDMRGRFGHAVRRLIQTIRQEAVYYDTSPRANVMGLPTKFAPAVLLVAFSFFLIVVADCYIAWITQQRLSIVLSLPMWITGAYGIWIIVGYLRRDSRETPRGRIRYFIYHFLVILFAIGLLSTLGNSQTASSHSGQLGSLLPAVLLVNFISWLLIAIAERFLGGHRWAITGSHNLRRYRKLLENREDQVEAGGVLRYFVNYNNADSPTVENITRQLDAVGHTMVNNALEADIQIVLMSNMFTFDDLECEGLHQVDTPVILVYLASMIIPAKYQNIYCYQVVDYRQRKNGTLKIMSENLLKSNIATSIGSAAEMIPAKLYRVSLPGCTGCWASIIWLSALLLLIVSLNGIILASIIGGISNIPAENF